MPNESIICHIIIICHTITATFVRTLYFYEWTLYFSLVIMTKFNIGFVQDPVFSLGLDIRSKLLRNELSIDQVDEDVRNALNMLYVKPTYICARCNVHWEDVLNQMTASPMRPSWGNFQARLNDLLELVDDLTVSSPDFSIFRDFLVKSPLLPLDRGKI